MTCAELTIDDMIDLALAPPSPHGSRRIELVYGSGSVRLVPQTVLWAARHGMEVRGKVEEVLEYVHGAFLVYREEVCRAFFAPHVLVDGAFEWPHPVEFPWDDTDEVISRAVTLARPDHVVIETERDGSILSETIEDCRCVPRGVVAKRTPLQFRVDPSRLAYVDQTEWQCRSLESYANPFWFILRDLRRGELSSIEVRHYLEDHLGRLAHTYGFPVGRRVA